LYGGTELFKSIACLSSMILVIPSQKNSEAGCELDEMRQQSVLFKKDSPESVSVTFLLHCNTYSKVTSHKANASQEFGHTSL